MFLGLDLGTSGLKGVIINEEGVVVAQANYALTVSAPHPTWSEQAPEDWWFAVEQVCEQLSQRVKLENVKAIGLSGQMHGATVLDQQGQVLRPCILWNDGRSKIQCDAVMAAHPELLDLSGNLAMPGFTLPKILWLKEHEPEVFDAIDKVLLPKDYLVYRLTGIFSSDCSDAAGTLWLNPETRQWDEQLLAMTGLKQANMPNVHEGQQVIGCLNAEVAKQLGLNEIPVVAGAGDNAAGAVGMGVTEPGQGFVSLGTSGVYFAVSEAHNAKPENTVHAFCHALPNRWHQMGVTLSAANSLSWFANLVSKSVPELLEELEHSAISKTSVIFLPYLNGERTPINDPLASGQFFGLVNSTQREEMTLAVLEGIAFSILDCQNALASAGTTVSELSLIGGGARSALWRQILANVLEKELTYRDGGDVGPGLGAARLALLGYREQEGEAIEALIKKYCQLPDVLATHIPVDNTFDYYRAKYTVYRNLYQQTKTLNIELTKLSMNP
ncbi:xylulokinase [Marinomonas ostreistagni]|uniref:Xylulose kinase n=1 Tax=Marinomonas ostreistagni TaxID=359209 RepID=A0ABS0Z7U3_9GAMM|nr:xylulokinase [Marinomonas ostreistagni]MBJ7549694.1 xylulokinase [Marinomonas ostreistagni]